jgi:Na+/glutamate symporter
VAHALHLPVMLTMLIFAILSKNLDRQFDLMELEFGANELFVVMLFVTVGASMKLSDLGLLGFSVLILIAARFLAMGWASSCLPALPA